MLQEFKDFINKGNIIDLAVAVIMAIAFKPIIDTLVDGVLLQLIGAIFDQPNFNGLTFDLSGTPIFYGSVISALINFLTVAAAVFFVLKFYNASAKTGEASAKTGEPAAQAPPGPSEVDLLTEIRDTLLTR